VVLLLLLLVVLLLRRRLGGGSGGVAAGTRGRAHLGVGCTAGLRRIAAPRQLCRRRAGAAAGPVRQLWPAWRDSRRRHPATRAVLLLSRGAAWPQPHQRRRTCLPCLPALRRRRSCRRRRWRRSTRLPRAPLAARARWAPARAAALCGERAARARLPAACAPKAGAHCWLTRAAGCLLPGPAADLLVQGLRSEELRAEGEAVAAAAACWRSRGGGGGRGWVWVVTPSCGRC
jgi:hypothetical protein